MITRTFISKCNTIFKDSHENFGLNPVGMLNYGNDRSRLLIYFDMSNIKSLINDNIERNTFVHTLKMTNCASINYTPEYKSSERASSFDVIAFKIPAQWDRGIGFDSSVDIWATGKSVISTQGSNWYNSCSGIKWNEIEIVENGEKPFTDGIYTIDFLYDELTKYIRGEKSVIIGKQHFDFGNEDLNIDITNYVNECLDGSPNYGICIAFSPILENKKEFQNKYVGFFTNETNTFFQPIVESKSNASIIDNRYTFISGKSNRLYFFATDGVNGVALDETPICTIDGVEYPVKCQEKGVYYAEVSNITSSKEIIKTDIWSNIICDGVNEGEIENEFIVHPNRLTFNKTEKINVSPSISGLNDNENIYQGDIRTISVIFQIPYSKSYELFNDSFYRIYVKDGKREIDVIDWDRLNIIGMEQEFTLKSDELLPSNYFIDLKVVSNKETRIFKEVGKFTIKSNATEMKK